MTFFQIYSVVFFYAVPLSNILAFASYTRWQIIDEDDGPGWKPSDTKWHRDGAIMRITVFFDAIFIVTRPDVPPAHLPLLLVLMVALWDIAINKFRGRRWFDVGVGGWDQRVGKAKWIFYLLGLIVSVVLLTNIPGKL